MQGWQQKKELEGQDPRTWVTMEEKAEHQRGPFPTSYSIPPTWTHLNTKNKRTESSPRMAQNDHSSRSLRAPSDPLLFYIIDLEKEPFLGGSWEGGSLKHAQEPLLEVLGQMSVLAFQWLSHSMNYLGHLNSA